jgi:hypothetical protein
VGVLFAVENGVLGFGECEGLVLSLLETVTDVLQCGEEPLEVVGVLGRGVSRGFCCTAIG